MPKKSFAIERDEEKRLTVTWKSFWKNFTIKFDGEVIGTISSQKELEKGQSFQLPDGSLLDVKLARTLMSADLQLLRNGKPLPGSGSDPRTKLKQSYGFIYFVGGFNFILGLIAILFQVEFLYEIGMGFYSIIVGTIFLILAFFVQKRSKLALILALLLYGLETVLTVFGGLLAAGVIVRILFIIYMWQGFKAIKELRAEDAELP
jgi:hypothetical protein